MDEQPSPNRDRPRDDSLNKALGRTIKVLRTEQGLGRKDLARAAGISYSYLTEIENGTKPASSSYLSLIAEALHVPLSELIEGAEVRQETGGPGSDTGTRSPRSPEWRSSAEGLGARAPHALDYWAGQMWRPDDEQRNAVAPPSARRSRALRASRPTNASMQQSLPEVSAGPLSTREVLDELAALLPSLSPADQHRVLDMAKRLAR